MFQANRWYTAQELVELLGIKDGKNFKRDCTNALDKMGIKYEYKKKQVYVLELPDTTEMRIKNILTLRGFRVDNIKEFAIFFYCLLNLPEYQGMPWEARAELIKENQGIDTDWRRLQAWGSKLKKLGILTSTNASDTKVWCSFWEDGKHYQTEVTDEEGLTIAKAFWKDFYQLRQNFSCSQDIAKQLYAKYGCWYFYCRDILFCAWENEEDLTELRSQIIKYVEALYQ